MKILLLGPSRPELLAYLQSFGDTVEHVEAPLSDASSCLEEADLLVSYGYRYLIPKGVVERFWHRIVNLHISLLPWNRGADPNLWSFLEDTPKGVTIHYIDSGLDTGDILAQQAVEPEPHDTLRSSYDRLSEAMLALFREIWPSIRRGSAIAMPQPANGTLHKLKDRIPFEPYLTDGWDTPVSQLVGLARNKES